MNVEAIDAAARAIYEYEPLTWGELSETYETIAGADRASLRAIAAAAISGADAYRTTALLKHLTDIEEAIQRAMIAFELQDRADYLAAKQSWGGISPSTSRPFW